MSMLTSFLIEWLQNGILFLTESWRKCSSVKLESWIQVFNYSSIQLFMYSTIACFFENETVVFMMYQMSQMLKWKCVFLCWVYGDTKCWWERRVVFIDRFNPIFSFREGVGCVWRTSWRLWLYRPENINTMCLPTLKQLGTPWWLMRDVLVCYEWSSARQLNLKCQRRWHRRVCSTSINMSLAFMNINVGSWYDWCLKWSYVCIDGNAILG